jgi:acetyltransferase
MTSHYLRHFFDPAAIAVIGASDRPDSKGRRVFQNLRASGFKGALYPVNPGHGSVAGETSYKSVSSIDGVVDLAIITCPTPRVPTVIRECAERGIRAAVVTSASFRAQGPAWRKQEQALRTSARAKGIRIIGPDCLGIMRPGIGLNATNSRLAALPGNLALVSQSGAVCSAILDWAHCRKIGFSSMVALGDTVDVDFGDVLDYLATDRETRSILLYIEAIRDARRFMSGLRAAARLKPVIVIKAGRHSEGSRAAISHTGNLVGADDVFDAALARAGAVRARTIEQLFSAAAVLSSGYRLRGNRLAIITNGGGPGILATDRAVDLGVSVPQLSEPTLRVLNDVLPPQWSQSNPLDLLADATPERYEAAVKACLADPGIDGVLTLLAPQAATDPVAAADRLIELARDNPKPVLASWLGEEQVRAARERFSGSRVPHFDTPEAAVEAYSYLCQYQRNQQLLMQVPGAVALRHEPNVQGARLIIEDALAQGRNTLTTMESKALLTAFGIPVVRTVEARSPNEALILAESLGYPVAMKISSPDISHKSSVGGVRLNVGNAQAARAAFMDLTVTAQNARPGASITGVTVERMHGKPNGRELIVGVTRDPVFGPVITFGAGGTMVELIRDRAVALPPLNEFIARDLIRRTRVAATLGEYQNLPAARIQALEQVILQVSDLVCQLPYISELDINPLVLDEDGALAVDVRFVVQQPAPSPDRYPHMAIYPYPGHLRSRIELADGSKVAVRPIRPEDAELIQDLMHRLSKEARYFRFMETLSEHSPAMLVRLTQIDYDREMALVAVETTGGAEQLLAVARYTTLPDGESCEFALVVADAWQGRGIGARLMKALIDTAASRGLKRMEGEVLANNVKMLTLMKKLEFSIRTSEDDYSIKRVERPLT